MIISTISKAWDIKTKWALVAATSNNSTEETITGETEGEEETDIQISRCELELNKYIRKYIEYLVRSIDIYIYLLLYEIILINNYKHIYICIYIIYIFLLSSL